MCGIAGWIAPNPRQDASSVLRAMTDAIAHRGPDGEGQFVTDTADGRYRVGLGHRRLAIIDLAAGQQPMHCGNRPLSIVFNGEIYNFRELRHALEGAGHRFPRTNSDTEVLLHAYDEWGAECVSRLRGMFAFAIWNAETESLFLARDHFGKKPLYLWENGETLVFGSEIKALLAYPQVEARLDEAAIADYLVYRYVPAPRTLFRGIRKLMPGSFATWKNGRLREHRYYLPPDGAYRPDREQPADPVRVFADALDEAVQMRLVSDVPFGAFLSGGIDSSTIVALMSRHLAEPVNTFSVGFAEAAYSELDYARLVAKRYNTRHHELITSAADIMDYLPRLVRFRDAPVAEASDVPIYLLSLEAAKSVKMVLTGEGADEFLAGYPKHRFEPMVAAYHRAVPEALHRIAVEPVIRHLPYGARRLKIMAGSVGLRAAAERLPRWFGAVASGELAALTPLRPDPHPSAESLRPFRPANDQSPLRKTLYFDQTSWLPDNLLERGDRMTMAASIEARMPFMDTGLAETIARLDDRHRLQGRVQKHVLRAAMAQELPPEILGRRKVGFRVPFNEWFRTTMKDWLHDHLMGPDSKTRDFYHREALSGVLAEHAAGRQNHERLLWTLMSLELFHREYNLAA